MSAGSPPWCSRSARALRLARFNVMIDDPNRPLWAGNFFTGVPAPAGALVVLLPIYRRACSAGSRRRPTLTLLYTLAIAFLMVSRLPVFSGKRVGKRVPPEMVLPVFVLVVLFFALLIAYPWWVLSIGTVCYLACLPLGWMSYREYQRKDAAAAAAQSRAGRRRRPDACRRSRPAGARASRAAQLNAVRRPSSGSSHAPRHPRPAGCRTQGRHCRRHADPALRAAPGAARASCSASKAPASSSISPSRCGCAPTTRWCSTTAAWSRWWPRPSR